MTVFVLIAALITIAGVALLVRPLFRPPVSTALQRTEQNIHYARERLQELETQQASAAISDEEYEALKQEIEVTLARDLDLQREAGNDPAQNDSDTPQHSNAVLITLLGTLVPITALLLYQLVGTPAAIDARGSVTEVPSQHEVENMLLLVEQRLQEQPDDVEGWRILGRSYLTMGRYADSIRANLALMKLTGEDANIYAQLADAAALQANGNLAGQPGEYIQRALELDPNQPQALWLAGLSAAQSGRHSLAREHWNRLLPLLEGAPQQQAELRAIIQQTLEQEQQLTAGGSASSGNPAADPSPSNEQAVTANGIRLRVELDDAVKALAEGGETVFVFARAKNGPPAPLAVKPLRVSDLPAEISLSDADAMMPQMKLSGFTEIVVSARIAKSGNPVAQPGDIQSAVVDTRNDEKETIVLVINQLVP